VFYAETNPTVTVTDTREETLQHMRETDGKLENNEKERKIRN
jgi:hypothetical protein